MNTRPAVWAPFPARVELAMGPDRHPMTRDDGGWWTADLELTPDTDYGYSLDGAAPLPDPRSPSQPNGVSALSRTVDRSAFNWTDGGFAARRLANAVIYELHVGTFTPAGTFDAAIDRVATRVLETEVGRPLVLIAESDPNDPRLARPIAEGGYGLDAVWADDVHHALHVALTGEEIGYYADFADADAWRARSSTHSCMPATTRLFGIDSTGDPRAISRVIGSSPRCRTTIRSATGRSANGSPTLSHPAGCVSVLPCC